MFWVRLSLKMCIPIKKLMMQVDSRDYALYQAYDQIDPFGNERFDLIGGIICHTLAQTSGVKQKTKPADFMVDWLKEPEKKQTPQQIYEVFKMFCESTGGEVVEGKKKV